MAGNSSVARAGGEATSGGESRAVCAAPADALPRRLEAVFGEIAATRMRGLPFVNERLRVEAVGFRRWEGRWLGVLITPWFMSLVLAPDDPSRWLAALPGQSRSYRFPAGVFDFIAARDESLGEFHSCSLFSPVFEFREQEVARATALAALAALFDGGARPGGERPGDRAAPPPAAGGARAVSKRDFLRGRWAGGDDR